MRSSPLWPLLIALGLLLAPGCGADAPQAEPSPQISALEVALVDPTVVQGGSLLLEVRGAEVLVPRHARVHLLGQINGQAFDQELPATWEQRAGALDVRVGWEALAPAHQGASYRTFQGDLEVVLDDINGSLQGRGLLPGTSLVFTQSLSPSFEVSDPALRANLDQLIPLEECQDLLLAGEGSSELALEGSFTPEGGAPRPINTLLPMEQAQGRRRASWKLTPGVFGLRPGVFAGRIRLLNTHSGGQKLASQPHEVQITLAPSLISGVSPESFSRGQVLSVYGQGLFAPDLASGSSMYFLFEGEFISLGGQRVELRGDQALQLVPDEIVDHTQVRLALRSQVEQDNDGLWRLVGLTAAPGTFTGTLTPVLVGPQDTLLGQSWEGHLTLTTTHQVVYLKYLPGFTEALTEFGLRNVAPEIQDRILEVVRRDYQGIHIEFTEQRPQDFAEYSVIEIGGTDPNGAGLLGLDNTDGKDTGNLRLDDVIGGENADSGEQGYYVYGGVFLRSFTAFSPSLAQEDLYISPWFDTLFSPFMPALGGSPVDATEWPGGPRSQQVEAAVLALGNLVGHTVTHEIGHSLGLAFFPEDLEGPTERFHNEGDLPNAIMDGGQRRPFEERAEVDGQGPARFTPENRAYLEAILPLP